MQERSDSMTGNFLLFLVLSFAILFGYSALMSRLNPPQKQPGKQQKVAAEDAGKEDRGVGAEQRRPEPPEDQPPQEPPQPVQDQRPGVAPPQPKIVKEELRQWLVLGSAEPGDPYRMLVTLDSMGAAVARIELSSPRYHDLEYRHGYLGHLVMDPTVLEDDPNEGVRVQVVGAHTPAAKAGLQPGDLIVAVGKQKINSVAELGIALRDALPQQREALLTIRRGDKKLTPRMAIGAPVQVVGPGTPAAKAAEGGLRPGDLIVAVGDEKISGVEDLRRTLERTKPNRTITLSVRRPGKQETLSLSVTLGRRPLEVIRPEGNDHPSFLLTLQHVQGKGVGQRTLQRPETIVEVGKELDGLDLWTGNWKVEASDQAHATFSKTLPKLGLKIVKTYRLAEVPEDSLEDADHQAYHLEFDVEIHNVGAEHREVAYQLDGPNGLPAEGAWYAYKVGRSWGGVGLRDVVVSFNHATPSLIGCPKIAQGKIKNVWPEDPLTYIGVDAQYFSCVLLPKKDSPEDIWFAESHPLLAGEPNEKLPKVTNTSCRVISKVHALAPRGTLSHRFVIFAGPKKPALLAHYELGELVYYGWFSWFAVPMAQILHVFYAVVGNYGLAILMLTVLVRGCMFPLSKKQALGAQKMQELQPEIKKLQEKYKKDLEARTKAQQELFRKHNYNPLSGCLVLFIQLPIFVALYRSLSVDIELRQAPLLWEGFPWCPNLSAPDMLFDWSGFLPEFVTRGVGILGLGPYFNLLPVLTIVLFIAQQKMFMPPPTDDQQAMQQKIMKYMMIFIGFLFFKVASGLCIYFIASSMWGLAERRFLPKRSAAAAADVPRSRADAKAKIKPPGEPPPKIAEKPAAAGRDGAAARRKKKRKKNRGKK